MIRGAIMGYDDFAIWVKEQREARNWSKEYLARVSGVSLSAIWRAEHPERYAKHIGAKSATNIAKAFNLPKEEALQRLGILDRRPASNNEIEFLGHVYRQLEKYGRQKELLEYAQFLLDSATKKRS